MSRVTAALVALSVVLCSCGGAWKQPTNDVIDCVGPELAPVIQDVVCNHAIAPESIAARVAWCIAEKQIHHLFGAGYCGAGTGDAGK